MLANRWRHLHCHIAQDCLIDIISWYHFKRVLSVSLTSSRQSCSFTKVLYIYWCWWWWDWCLTSVTPWYVICKLWCLSWMSLPSCRGPSRSRLGRSWGWSPFWSPWTSIQLIDHLILDHNYQRVHHDQPTDHIDHLFHAVDEEWCNEEDPGGENCNSPSDCHLVMISCLTCWSCGDHMVIWWLWWWFHLVHIAGDGGG